MNNDVVDSFLVSRADVALNAVDVAVTIDAMPTINAGSVEMLANDLLVINSGIT